MNQLLGMKRLWKGGQCIHKLMNTLAPCVPHTAQVGPSCERSGYGLCEEASRDVGMGCVQLNSTLLSTSTVLSSGGLQLEFNSSFLMRLFTLAASSRQLTSLNSRSAFHAQTSSMYWWFFMSLATAPAPFAENGLLQMFRTLRTHSMML